MIKLSGWPSLKASCKITGKGIRRRNTISRWTETLRLGAIELGLGLVVLLGMITPNVPFGLGNCRKKVINFVQNGCSKKGSNGQ